jgi:hypothetical protein
MEKVLYGDLKFGILERNDCNITLYVVIIWEECERKYYFSNVMLYLNMQYVVSEENHNN